MGNTETYSITGISGASLVTTAIMGINHVLKGCTLDCKTGDTDANTGKIDCTLYNFTGSDQNVDALTINYGIIKLQ